MRNLLLLALLGCVALAGCDPAQARPPAEDLPVATQSAASAKIIATDPATAIAVVSTGLDWAVKVKSLFGGSRERRETAKLRAAIAEMQQQNTVIINRLGEVLDILRNLGVTIRAGVRDELITQQKTTLNSNLQLFYETWQAELNDPDAERDAALRYERDILPQLRPLARQIASPEVYGYAQFESVGHAMAVEMWVSRRLGERFAFRQEAARFYIRYFHRVLSTTESGSVGYQLANAQAQVRRMDSVLAVADDRVARTPRSVVRTNVLVGRGSRGKCDWEVRADIEHVVSGNRSTGYQFQERQINVREANRECVSDGPHCARCKQFQTEFGVMALPERPDPVAPADGSLSASVAYWNAARTVRAAAGGDLQVLEKTAQTAHEYLAIANDAASEP